MLRSLWLTCVLMVASAPAWAQSAPADKAQVTARSVEQKLGQLVTRRAQLSRQLQDQIAVSERLKNEKASWRKDRELNAAQANAADTAARLTAIDRQIQTAQQDLVKARKAVVAAIDAELAAGVGGPRAAELTRLRGQLVPASPVAKKIVIPDAEIDPLADPDELEQQAKALAAAEKQLDAQRMGLDQQAKDLRQNYELRQAHERTHELSTQDDDQPHRAADRSTRETSLNPTAGVGGQDSSGGNFGSDKSPTASLESTAVALGEVIDRSTIEGLVRASRSGDPKQRADAATAARDAVAKRLADLKKKRQMIEQRAKQLRNK